MRLLEFLLKDIRNYSLHVNYLPALSKNKQDIIKLQGNKSIPKTCNHVVLLDGNIVHESRKFLAYTVQAIMSRIAV